MSSSAPFPWSPVLDEDRKGPASGWVDPLVCLEIVFLAAEPASQNSWLLSCQLEFSKSIACACTAIHLTDMLVMVVVVMMMMMRCAMYRCCSEDKVCLRLHARVPVSYHAYTGVWILSAWGNGKWTVASQPSYLFLPCEWWTLSAATDSHVVCNRY